MKRTFSKEFKVRACELVIKDGIKHVAVAEIAVPVKGKMNGCRKQPPLICPAISANMQLRSVNRLATFPPDHHSVFYAIFRVYTNHEKEPSTQQILFKYAFILFF